MKLEIKPLGNIDIHSIAIGIVGSGLQYTVGKPIRLGDKTAIVSHIVRDESSYEFFGEIVYMIFASIDNSEPIMIKSFVNQPVYISVKI